MQLRLRKKPESDSEFDHIPERELQMLKQRAALRGKTLKEYLEYREASKNSRPPTPRAPYQAPPDPTMSYDDVPEIINAHERSILNRSETYLKYLKDREASKNYMPAHERSILSMARAQHRGTLYEKQQRVIKNVSGVLQSKVGRIPDNKRLMRKASNKMFRRLQR
jgi:hypothetical protein